MRLLVLLLLRVAADLNHDIFRRTVADIFDRVQSAERHVDNASGIGALGLAVVVEFESSFLHQDDFRVVLDAMHAGLGGVPAGCGMDSCTATDSPVASVPLKTLRPTEPLGAVLAFIWSKAKTRAAANGLESASTGAEAAATEPIASTKIGSNDFLICDLSFSRPIGDLRYREIRFYGSLSEADQKMFRSDRPISALRLILREFGDLVSRSTVSVFLRGAAARWLYFVDSVYVICVPQFHRFTD